jgi:hypothetical protein
MSPFDNNLLPVRVAIRLTSQCIELPVSGVLAILCQVNVCSSLPLILCGSSSVAERQLPKLNVAGSIPVSRSIQSMI